jgi:3-methyladenine DNA glycosylase AlkD
MTTASEVLDRLRVQADPSRLPGMARVGINVDQAFGVSMPQLRSAARRLGRDHTLALSLWRSRVHEARILASLVDDPAQVTRDQMDRWAVDLDSWDVCDQVCANLFRATQHADATSRAWVRRPEEFVKRAGFSLIAERAAWDQTASNAAFERCMPAIRRGALDERNFVKKSVNWALRQIGKRNLALNASAIATAQRLLELDSRSARWIARHALRELLSDAVQVRLRTGRVDGAVKGRVAPGRARGSAGDRPRARPPR